MFLKRFFSRFLVILRSHADNNATLFEFLHPHLELREGLSDAKSVTKLDALQTVVTNDTAPYSIVQVENQAFLELSLNGTNDIHHPRSHIWKSIHAQDHFCADVDIWRKHKVTTELILETGNVTNEKVRILLREVHQLIVELPDLIRQ